MNTVLDICEMLLEYILQLQLYLERSENVHENGQRVSMSKQMFNDL